MANQVPTGHIIIIGREKPTDKSYLVKYHGPMEYTNPRKPHVETQEVLEAKQKFLLGEVFNHNGAIGYNVIGLTNNGHPAHITVQYTTPKEVVTKKPTKETTTTNPAHSTVQHTTPKEQVTTTKKETNQQLK